MPSLPALVAATLAFVLGAAHSYLGERYILIRLFRRSDLPHLFGNEAFTRRTLRFAWHLTTVAFWGLAAVLLVVEGGGSTATAGGVIAATFAASAVVTFIGSRGRHLAWPVFLAIAVATWVATR